MKYCRVKLLVLLIGHAIMSSSNLPAAEMATQDKPPQPDAAEIINKKTADIRARLQEQFANEDFGFLLAKKESMDSFMLPLLLPYEMQQAAIPDYCRVLRHEYSANPVTYKHAADFKDFTDHLFSMESLRGSQCIEYDLRQVRYTYIGADYPVLLESTVHSTTDSCMANTTWYEPYLANRNLDITAHPECLRYGWNRNSLTLWPRITNEKPILDKIPAANPVFNNPNYIYSLLDALHLKRIVELKDLDKINPKCATPVVENADGRVLREIGVKTMTDGRFHVTINQRPVVLKHLSPRIARISRESGGKVYPPEDFQPSVDVNYLNGGRTLELVFAENNSLGGKLFPQEITMNCKGAKLYEAFITNVKLVGNQKAVSYLDAWTTASEVLNTKTLYQMLNTNDHKKIELYSEHELSEAHDTLTNRRRMKFNIVAAAYQHDWGVLDYSLSAYRKQLKDDGCGDVFYIYGLESLVELCFEHCGREATEYLALDCLAVAYQHCSKNVLKEHISRLLDQYRLGFALIAIRTIKEPKVNDPALAEWANSTEQWLVDAITGKMPNMDRPQFAGMKEPEKFNQLMLERSNAKKGSN